MSCHSAARNRVAAGDVATDDRLMRTTTLWRPVGPEELALLEESGWTRWPPRLPEQPIFYPVLNRDYAIGSRGTGTSSTAAPGT